MAGQPRIGFENRYLRKNGSLVHIMSSARWSEADRLRIGIALYPEHGDSEEQLLMHADKAMYAEKKGKIAAED